MNLPRLAVEDISHSFFGVSVLRGVSLHLEPGEVLGLVGENGAGKSTLMNIVGGLVRPDAGLMQFNGEEYSPADPADAGRHGIAFVHQELNLFSHLSVADNLFLTTYPRTFGAFVNRRAARDATEAALATLDLPFNSSTPVERLSPGQRQLLEILKATYGSPALVILDEPTTSLTSRETEKLFELIHRKCDEGTSFVYISHILSDVKRLCDQIAVLRDGALVDVRRAADLPVDEMISAMVGRPLEQLYPTREGRAGEVPVLEVSGLSATGLVEDASVTVCAGEVVGIFGLMGSGRTELARVVYGLEKADAGTVKVAGEDVTHFTPRRRIAAGLAFVTEDRRGEGLLMDSSVQTNAALPSLSRWVRSVLAPLPTRAIGQRVTATCATIRLKASDLSRSPVRSLSGGNQQKVVLAKWLLTEPRVLILDEPTRGVDVGAKYEVHRAILTAADSGAGLLVISSELPELLGICNRVLVMRQGKIVATFDSASYDTRMILGAAFGEAPDLVKEESA